VIHLPPPLSPATPQIPTFRADPLQPACDTWCEFPVADRANAVQQWVDAVNADPSMVKGAWIFMLETDYVWRKPVEVRVSVWHIMCACVCLADVACVAEPLQVRAAACVYPLSTWRDPRAPPAAPRTSPLTRVSTPFPSPAAARQCVGPQGPWGGLLL